MGLLLFVATALAGYGDPVDGVPSPIERELFLFTDLARVDLPWFEAELRCWGEVDAAQRAPHAPLAYSADLGAAARYHTENMAGGEPFSHSGPGDTTFEQRLRQFYDGYAIGENIAAGFRSPHKTVSAWLCSTGHRENLLSDDFEELGVGYDRTFWTQDFGASGRSIPVLRMGAHSTEDVPSGEVRLFADLGAAQPPDGVDAIVDGDRVRMDLFAGSEARGVWSVDVPADGGCHVYWFTAQLATGAVARFPEEGAYTFGACDDLDDVEAAWLAPDAIVDLEAAVPEPGAGCGCATTSAPGVGWLGAAALLLARRRRR